MNRKLNGFLVGAGLAAVASQGIAAPFISFDPRSMAMGGAGVAVTDFNNAPVFNPALMARASESDDFNLAFPVFGGRAFDQDDLIDVVEEDAANVIDALEQARDVVNTSLNTIPVPGFGTLTLPSPAQLNEVENATNRVNDLLTNADERAISIEVGGALVVGIPSRKFGMAVSLIGWSATAGQGDYSDADQTLLGDLATAAGVAATNITELQEVADGVRAPGDISFSPLAPCAGLNNFDDQCNVLFDENDITSEIRARGIAVGEVGLTIAREFAVGSSSIAVGVTPKMVSVAAFDFVGNINTADTGDFEDSTNETSNFNIDLGVAHGYESGWQVGVVVKNLLSQDYEAPADNLGNVFTVELEPQIRAGVAYQNDWLLAALDVDVQENKGVGFGDDSQYVSFGVEFDAFDWAQLRLGARKDMANSDRDAALSAGFGLSPFGAFHFDFAVTADDFSDPNEVGAALQLAFTF